MKARDHFFISINCFVHLVLISADSLLTAGSCKNVQAGIMHRQKRVIPPGDKFLQRKAVILRFRLGGSHRTDLRPVSV